MMTVVPAVAGWAVLLPVSIPGDPIDYYAEPIVGWVIDTEMASSPTPVTLLGWALPMEPISRPDDSVHHQGRDWPAFEDFLKAQRALAADLWDDPEKPVVAAGPNAAPPKLDT